MAKWQDHFLDRMQSPEPIDWTMDDTKQLAALLRNPVLAKAFQQAWDVTRDWSNQLMGLDFTNPQAAALVASKYQGQVAGISWLVNRLLELATEEDDGGTEPSLDG